MDILEQEALPLFSKILNDAMYAEVKANRRLVEGIKDVKVTMRQVQRYRAGTRVPDLITAKAITKFLGINIRNDELSKILLLSREKCEQMNNKQLNKTYKRVYVNFTNIDIGIDTDVNDTIEVVHERLFELYGDRDSMGRYIEQLIEKDLKEHII